MSNDNGTGHGIEWVQDLPENPLHRSFRDRPWIRALRWATSCAAVTVAICIILTLL